MGTGQIITDQKTIDRICPGFSQEMQWNFFQQFLKAPEMQRIACLGVFQGRDIGYMAAAMADRDDWHIWGIDLFRNEFYGDGEGEEDRGKPWEEVWSRVKGNYSHHPDRAAAEEHLAQLGISERTTLITGDAVSWLNVSAWPPAFDCIYIDTEHTYHATRRAILASLTRIRPGGLICGDDWVKCRPTWGVGEAVRDCFKTFEVFGNYVWYARPDEAYLRWH